MSRVRPPENFEIASLKKKQQTVFDPMTPGAGTPWEDRASNGLVGAFIKTCTASLTAPGELTKSIRRPETTADARGFVFGICGIWGISALMHFAYFLWRGLKTPGAEIDTTNTAVLGLLAVGGASVGGYFLFKIYNAIYGRLIAQEKDAGKIPEVLLYNVNAYALGPNLLALIPFAGPIIALLWMFADLVAVGNKRLRLTLPAALIDALISLAAVLAIAGGIYAIGEMLILHKIMGFDAIDLPLAPPVPLVK
jgi:hypothetical protein